MYSLYFIAYGNNEWCRFVLYIGSRLLISFYLKYGVAHRFLVDFKG